MVDWASDVGFRTLFGLMVCRILNIAPMASILRDTHQHLQVKYADRVSKIQQGVFPKSNGGPGPTSASLTREMEARNIPEARETLVTP
jgi:hypothetical protein